MWVTAIYSNPSGESEPSNVVVNEDLPISVGENDLQNELSIFYDVNNQKVFIKNGEDNYKINIFNTQGKLILSQNRTKDGISIDYLQKGLYIVEILVEDKEVKRMKIIK